MSKIKIFKSRSDSLKKKQANKKYLQKPISFQEKNPELLWKKSSKDVFVTKKPQKKRLHALKAPFSGGSNRGCNRALKQIALQLFFAVGRVEPSAPRCRDAFSLAFFCRVDKHGRVVRHRDRPLTNRGCVFCTKKLKLNFPYDIADARRGKVFGTGPVFLFGAPTRR